MFLPATPLAQKDGSFAYFYPCEVGSPRTRRRKFWEFGTNSRLLTSFFRGTVMKAAIFYFTMSGNTELAAKEVAEATGAPLVRLHADPPYTVDDIDWTHPDARCTREHKDHSLLPRVKPFGVDISSLDTVFIGFPIW